MNTTAPHKKVLYIEDEDFDLLAMQRAFAAAGCKDWLYAARDGGEALEWLQGTGKYADRSQYPIPDLVLLDIRLPKASGLDVLRWIRDQPLLGALPVIMFSGSDLDEDVADAYRVGANVYLCKPLGEKLPQWCASSWPGSTLTRRPALTRQSGGYWPGAATRSRFRGRHSLAHWSTAAKGSSQGHSCAVLLQCVLCLTFPGGSSGHSPGLHQTLSVTSPYPLPIPSVVPLITYQKVRRRG